MIPKILFLLFLLSSFKGFTQDTELKQLQYLLSDLKNNFRESIGAAIQTANGDSTNLSKVSLEGTFLNYIDVAKNGSDWASYSANISDSCSLNDANKFAKYWRSIVSKAAPGYIEKNKNSKLKTLSGNPILGYDFELTDDSYKYWIDINYSKRAISKGYIVMILLGRQIR